MKITTKTTKEQLKSFLGANAMKVKKADKDLFDQIAYASKMAKKDDSKVTRKDLVDLVKSVMSVLGDKCVEPALAQETPATPQAENSGKKLTGKKQTMAQVILVLSAMCLIQKVIGVQNLVTVSLKRKVMAIITEYHSKWTPALAC